MKSFANMRPSREGIQARIVSDPKKRVMCQTGPGGVRLTPLGRWRMLLCTASADSRCEAGETDAETLVDFGLRAL